MAAAPPYFSNLGLTFEQFFIAAGYIYLTVSVYALMGSVIHLGFVLKRRFIRPHTRV